MTSRGRAEGEKMRSFQHVETPLRVSSGPESLGQLSRELDRLKVSRAVIFCGRTLAKDGSPLDLVRAALGDRCAGVITSVRPHSPLPSVLEAAEELRRLGAGVEEFADGLKITPRPLHGATVQTYNDHRMAMSLALVGLRVPGVVIDNPGCVAKTYPEFWQDLDRLVGR